MADNCCPEHFVGFCLANGTPIIIMIDNNVQTGWINVRTGVFTFGAPPAGTVQCENEIRALTCATDSIRICGETATALVTRVNASITAVVLSAANPTRKTAILWNDSTSTVNIKFGSAASMTDFTWRIGPQSGYELPAPVYVGIISGIWDAANGAMQITEES